MVTSVLPETSTNQQLYVPLFLTICDIILCLFVFLILNRGIFDIYVKIEGNDKLVGIVTCILVYFCEIFQKLCASIINSKISLIYLVFENTTDHHFTKRKKCRCRFLPSYTELQSQPKLIGKHPFFLIRLSCLIQFAS